jgi:hypothetical protein
MQSTRNAMGLVGTGLSVAASAATTGYQEFIADLFPPQASLPGDLVLRVYADGTPGPSDVAQAFVPVHKPLSGADRKCLAHRMASFFSLLPVYTTTANRQMGEVSLRASGSKDLRIAVQTSFTSNAAAAMGGSAEGWTRISATKCAARTHSSACISQTPKCSTSRRTTSSRSSTVRRCAPYFSLLPLMNIMFTYEQR